MACISALLEVWKIYARHQRHKLPRVARIDLLRSHAFAYRVTGVTIEAGGSDKKGEFKAALPSIQTNTHTLPLLI